MQRAGSVAQAVSKAAEADTYSMEQLGETGKKLVKTIKQAEEMAESVAKEALAKAEAEKLAR